MSQATGQWFAAIAALVFPIHPLPGGAQRKHRADTMTHLTKSNASADDSLLAAHSKLCVELAVCLPDERASVEAAIATVAHAIAMRWGAKQRQFYPTRDQLARQDDTP